MNEIAKIAGVSNATVSRAFRTPEKVRPELKEKIFKIAAENHYVYNASAADLKRRVSNTVGVLFQQRIGAVFSKTFMAIQETLLEKNISVIIGHTQFKPEVESQLLQQFLERQVAGIILSGFTKENKTLIKKFSSQGIPSVIIWEILKGSDFNYVGIDNHNAAFKATEYLIGLGHRRIGLLIGPYQKMERIQNRYDGYKDALTKNKIEIDQSIVISSELGFLQGKEAMHRLLKAADRPSAVFAASDYLAMGALKAIKEAGMKVPKDISLMGLDDAEFAAYCDPPLSTVRGPAREIGKIAAKILLEIKDEPGLPPKQYCLDSDLIIRDSCAPHF
ncbi:MAG: LacI family transcriptional regulator [Desulfotignum sp.]|nr:LacI family transcriptional regulator [Desulfotignum sp.]MCF8089128.1 LacI family transcriptional regulator [Desulfotignum sp.]MCF8138669.1 LacI family transcriptional regulator [Desulfotignum sp.]